MSKSDLKIILGCIICFAIVILAIKFFIFLLPYIIVLIIAYWIMMAFKKNKTTTDKTKNKKLNDNVIDAEIVREKKD